MTHTRFCLLLLGLTVGLTRSLPALAAGEVYVCTDSTGARVYQNTGPTDHCRRLNLDPVLTVPQGPVRSAGPGNRQAPGGPTAGSNPTAVSNPAATGFALPSAGGNRGSVVSPSSMGSSGAVVTARESDRLKILEAELRDEERRLQSLQQRQLAGANDDRLTQDLLRSQASLDALRREISKVQRP